MIDKVYVVTSGSYSDFGLDGIFSTREKAEEYIRLFPDSHCNGVDEWTLDPEYPERRNGMSIYRVEMLRDGTTKSVYMIPLYRGREDNVETRLRVLPTGAGPAPNDLVCQCYAMDEKHAVKIANEKRIQMIVSGEWAE